MTKIFTRKSNSKHWSWCVRKAMIGLKMLPIENGYVWTFPTEEDAKQFRRRWL